MSHPSSIPIPIPPGSADSLPVPPAVEASEYAIPAPTYDLLGVGMSILTISDAVQRILSAVESRKKGYVCVTGMHGIMEARDDPKLQRILNRAFLCTPDGMPTVWLGKARGHSMERVYGPDLTLALLEATQNTSVRHFFYGGAEGVAEKLKRRMEERFPGLQVSGTYCPPFRPLNDAEKESLKALVEKSEADILWVGLSTPKQERFMAEFLPQLPVKLMLGVGAAFDFHTGRAKQAPRWMMRSGLEWFFRLVTEPRRLWKRYLIQVPRFASLVGLDAVGLVSHSSENPEMPQAFSVIAHWPRVFLMSLICWMASIVSLWSVTGPATALVVALLTFVPIACFLAATVLSFVSSEEERLDRIAPVYLLLTFLLTAGAAIFAPLGTILLLVFGLQTSVVPLGTAVAGVSLAPLLLFIVTAIAIGIVCWRKGVAGTASYDYKKSEA